ncbi:MAG: nitrate reductase associated protein [Steroidobacter sp.]
MEPSQIFDFELDFAGTLRCIPMIVRFKLDRCGVKLSMRQWGRFSREERDELVRRDCSTPKNVAAYGIYLIGLIESKTSDPAVLLPAAGASEWDDVATVPARLVAYAENLGVSPPSQQQWASLTSLHRFALFKLTRPGHDNDNFVPAMREFGLTD